ncbi:MAG TPA: membrane protein insertion efficiency factor YidD [Bacillales bacterium]|nr:membrane protein insertion efficiency factor YidD [Bacillales bacterium]
MKRTIVFLIRGYQKWISSWTPPTCRFYPSCSQYALEAVQRFGVVKGGWLTLVRLSKCHPLHKGGIDPVPANRSVEDSSTEGSCGRP